MKIEYAKNPQWADSEKSIINLTVRFEGFPQELPFTACDNDTESHGKELFKRAVAGEFGKVSEFKIKK